MQLKAAKTPFPLSLCGNSRGLTGWGEGRRGNPLWLPQIRAATEGRPYDIRVGFFTLPFVHHPVGAPIKGGEKKGQIFLLPTALSGINSSLTAPPAGRRKRVELDKKV